MAGRTARCNRCGVQLLVPPGSRGGSVRCGVCWAVTPAPSPSDPAARGGHHLHERVRWAKNWVKGLAAPLRGQLAASFGGGGGGGSVSLPSYPSVHGGRRALLVGITYRSMRYELKGSVNDVKCMKYLLSTKFGFPEECILMLTGNDEFETGQE